MMARFVVLVALVVSLAGCVGSAGIGADGSATAGPETSVYELTCSPERGVEARAVLAKKASISNSKLRSGSGGPCSFTLEIGEMHSGDRTADKSIAAVSDALAVVAPVVGTLTGTKIKLSGERQQAQDLARQQQAALRAQQAGTRRLEAQRALLLQQQQAQSANRAAGNEAQ